MEPSFTPQRAVTIACRTLCVFFLVYAIANFVEIPSLLIGLMHYRSHGEATGSSSYYAYWTRRYSLSITAALVRSLVEFWLAGVFYRVSRFMLGEDAVKVEA
jgi:hypothetical protein